MASLPACPQPLEGLHIVILGRGRVGRALDVGFSARGARVNLHAGSTTPGIGEADLVMLTVPDDALADVAARIAPAMGTGQVLAHTSGRHGLGVLGAADLPRLAFHPAMTFTGNGGDAARLAGARVGITTDPQARELAERLATALDATPTFIAEEQRALYHAGLSHAANHLVTLIAEAQTLLTRAGVDDPSAVLRPLVEAALDNALTGGAFATTGPVVRGDFATVATHLQVIGDDAPSYRALAESTLRLAVADGRLPHDATLMQATRMETV